MDVLFIRFGGQGRGGMTETTEVEIPIEDLAQELAEKLFGSVYERTYFIDIKRKLQQAYIRGRDHGR